MRNVWLSKIAVALGSAAMLAVAAPAFAATPDVSANPDTDTFRTGGCTGCFITQMQAVVAQFATITRAFRACYTNVAGGSKIVDDGSACDGNGHGRLADFFVIQGTLKTCTQTTPGTCDTGSVGVPNPGTTEYTYRVSGNGSGNGIGCAAASSPVGTGFLAPEGLDGTPNTADDAGGSGVFGQLGAGTGAGTATMVAAPLTQCDNLIQTYDTLGTLPAVPLSAKFCVVNFDLSKDGTIQNDQTGAGLPSQFPQPGSNITTLSATNETTNTKISCDTAFSDLPTGDFLPPKPPYNSPDVYGAQIMKIVAKRTTHSIAGGADAKLHLNMAQIQNIFGDPPGNSVCQLKAIGAVDAGTTNTTACIRPSGSGTRETTRLTFMANTAGPKNFSEDTAGGSNGTVTSCTTQTKEGGGLTLTGSKRVKQGNGNQDVQDCVAGFPGSIGYVDGNRFDGTMYGVVVEGVDTDAAAQGTAGVDDLRQLVKCGHYRYWGPLAGGLGAHNGGASVFITAHRAALKTQSIYVNANAYIPFGVNTGVGVVKSSVDGPYSIQFVPTSCPAAPRPELTISASPTVAP